MTCHSCRIECKRNGKHRNGLQRYRCAQCQKTFTEAHERPFDAMYTPADKGLLALQLLLEGNSIRSAERITGLHRDTILRLLVLAGERCEKVLGRMIVIFLRAGAAWPYILVAIFVTAIAYLLFFLIVPWIMCGFRSHEK